MARPIRGCILTLLLSLPLAAQQDVDLRKTPLRGARVETVGRDLDLGVVLGGAIAANGDLLVVEQGNPAATRISPDGRKILVYGRGGDGPGEHRFPYRIVELSDGAVLVYDLAIRRFSEYTRDGAFVKRWAPSVDVVTIDALVRLPNRGFALSGIVRDPRASKSGVHVFDSTFTLVRSFGDLPPARSRELLEQWGAGYLTAMQDGSLLYSRRLPYELSVFSPEGARTARLPVRIAVSAQADDAFRVESVNGTTTTSIRSDLAYPLEATPLPNGSILSARVVGDKRHWDLVTVRGQVTWSGLMPPSVTYCIGMDYRRRTLWCVGERDDVPVLFRIGL